MAGDGPKQVRDCIYSGGLDGKVFVDRADFSRPYIFLAPPVGSGDDSIKIRYVSMLDQHVKPQNRTLRGVLDDREYDSKAIPKPVPRQILDESLVKRARLEGVGD